MLFRSASRHRYPFFLGKMAVFFFGRTSAMTQMVISGHHKPVGRKILNQMPVASHILTHSMADLNDRTGNNPWHGVQIARNCVLFVCRRIVYGFATELSHTASPMG